MKIIIIGIMFNTRNTQSDYIFFKTCWTDLYVDLWCLLLLVYTNITMLACIIPQQSVKAESVLCLVPLVCSYGIYYYNGQIWVIGNVRSRWIGKHSPLCVSKRIYVSNVINLKGNVCLLFEFSLMKGSVGCYVH